MALIKIFRKAGRWRALWVGGSVWSPDLTLWGALFNLLFTMDYDFFTTHGRQTCRKRWLGKMILV